jgi:hypothetical protein
MTMWSFQRFSDLSGNVLNRSDVKEQSSRPLQKVLCTSAVRTAAMAVVIACSSSVATPVEQPAVNTHQMQVSAQDFLESTAARPPLEKYFGDERFKDGWTQDFEDSLLKKASLSRSSFSPRYSEETRVSLLHSGQQESLDPKEKRLTSSEIKDLLRKHRKKA